MQMPSEELINATSSEVDTSANIADLIRGSGSEMTVGSKEKGREASEYRRMVFEL